MLTTEFGNLQSNVPGTLLPLTGVHISTNTTLHACLEHPRQYLIQSTSRLLTCSASVNAGPGLGTHFAKHLSWVFC